MLRVLSVLKSGGDFDEEYVRRLYCGVEYNRGVECSFTCLSDVYNSNGIMTVPLVSGLSGWWAKLELFRFIGPVVYFDLDTLIVGRLDELFRLILASKQTIFMLRSFRSNQPASGVMGWNGDFRFVYEDFKQQDISRYRGDQEYISATLAHRGVQPEFIQDHFPGVYSFKRHCQKGIPKDARIVCFHGRPRPKDVGWLM